MNNKQGISDVVAVVLIIMITVAAIAIVWGAIIPLVTKSTQGSTACFSAQSDITLLNDGFTCINNSAIATNTSVGNIEIHIKNGPDASVVLTAVQAIITDVNGNSFSYRVNKTNTQAISANVTGVSGNLPGNNEEKTINVWAPSLQNMSTVKIAPIISVGKTESLCAESQEVTLVSCA